jgi:hypothetical protein
MDDVDMKVDNSLDNSLKILGRTSSAPGKLEENKGSLLDPTSLAFMSRSLSTSSPGYITAAKLKAYIRNSETLGKKTGSVTSSSRSSTASTVSVIAEFSIQNVITATLTLEEDLKNLEDVEIKAVGSGRKRKRAEELERLNEELERLKETAEQLVKDSANIHDAAAAAIEYTGRESQATENELVEEQITLQKRVFNFLTSAASSMVSTCKAITDVTVRNFNLTYNVGSAFASETKTKIAVEDIKRAETTHEQVSASTEVARDSAIKAIVTNISRDVLNKSIKLGENRQEINFAAVKVALANIQESLRIANEGFYRDQNHGVSYNASGAGNLILRQYELNNKQSYLLENLTLEFRILQNLGYPPKGGIHKTIFNSLAQKTSACISELKILPQNSAGTNLIRYLENTLKKIQEALVPFNTSTTPPEFTFGSNPAAVAAVARATEEAAAVALAEAAQRFGAPAFDFGESVFDFGEAAPVSGFGFGKAAVSAPPTGPGSPGSPDSKKQRLGGKSHKRRKSKKSNKRRKSHKRKSRKRRH